MKKNAGGNIHECLYNHRKGKVFLFWFWFSKSFLSLALKAEFTCEMFMHFYLKIKNKLMNANSQSS